VTTPSLNLCAVYCPSTILNCKKCLSDGSTISCKKCIYGYNLSATSTCGPTCGDGIFIPSAEQCEDNNTVNGDGCSSTCTV
jgi:cysteine-rich repeat protein